MAKKIELAISNALPLKVTTTESSGANDVHGAAHPADIHGAALPMDVHGAAMPMDVHGAALPMDIHGAARPLDVHGAAPTDVHGAADPLGMMTASKGESVRVLSEVHGTVSIPLPQHQTVSHIEVHRGENGELIVTLHE